MRHSAATAMLRSGASLEAIGTLLRHRSPDTTAIYAKVNLPMLLSVAQPVDRRCPMTMREQVERYLAFRRHQGYKLLNEERMLHDWADHAMARGDEFASAAAMIDWASGATSPANHARQAIRCSLFRRLAARRGRASRDPSTGCCWPKDQAKVRPAFADARTDQSADGGCPVPTTGRFNHATYLPLHDRADGDNRPAAVGGVCIAADRHHP